MNIRSRTELEAVVKSGNKIKYVFFWGHRKRDGGVSKSCFSQWYDCPYQCDGKTFLTAEHHMMYQKAVLFGDSRASKRVLAASSPGEAKAIGREVSGFDQGVWDAQRLDLVIRVNKIKFGAHLELKNFLINTGDRILVEASPIDKVWGIGLAEDDPDCHNPSQWKGENLLGFALMSVRESLS